MEGMIFAAGLGTRLRPLTNDRPKALVELGGKTLLERVIGRMRAAGIGRIVVNVHHFAGQVKDFLQEKGYLEQDVVVSDESGRLLNTGGGLRKARPLFTSGEAVLIHNVDILIDLDLRDLMAAHGNRYATLAVRKAEPGRALRFADGVLKGWENSLTGEQKIVDGAFARAGRYSFCGIQVVSPAFLENIEGCGCFSIIDEYLAQAARRDIGMYFYDGFFMDLGTPEAIREAERAGF